jgi:Flp pilus assembly protein TadD
VTIAEQMKALDQGRQEQLAVLLDLRKLTIDQNRQVLKRFDSIDRQLADLRQHNSLHPEGAFQPLPGTEDWYSKAERTKDSKGKIALYTEAINHNQNLAHAYFGRGLVYFNLKDFNSAYFDFDRTVRLDPSFASAYTNRGASSDNLGRTDAAIADYKTSMQLDAGIVQNYDNLKQIYLARKNYAEVYALAKLRLQHGKPDDAVVYGQAAWYALFNRDFRNAIAYSQEGLRIDPGARWISTNLAHGYLFTGQFETAKSIYLKYSGIKLSDLYWDEVVLNDFQELQAAGLTHPRMNDLRASLYGNLSYYLLFERRFQQAAKYARAGLESDPSASWINANLAHSLLFTNQTRQASEIYDRYLGEQILGKRWEESVLEDFDALRVGGITNAKMDEVSARMFTSLSWELLLNREYQSCITAANNSIKLEPADLMPYTNLAHCYLLTGRYEAAKDIYVKNKGQYVGNKSWEAVINEDFNELRKRGIYHPDMERVRAALR